MEKKLAIGIISFERSHLTQRCLDSIRAVSSVPYHIFIADNGSRFPQTRAALERWEQDPDVTLIRLDANYGPSYGRNIVIEKSGLAADVFAMIDNDVVVLKGWDTAAFAAIEKGVDLVQAKMLTPGLQTVERGPNRARQDSLSAHPEYIGRGVDRYAPIVSQPQNVAIVGCGSFVRAEVYRKIGVYDPELHMGEDYDLSFRAAEAGFKLGYVPTCEMVHDHEFDFEYDLIRSDVGKLLRSYLRMWRKQQKTLLSPDYLAWYMWLYRYGEPMYMPSAQRHKHLFRRIRRRLAREWLMRRNGSDRGSLAGVGKTAKKLASLLGQ